MAPRGTPINIKINVIEWALYVRRDRLPRKSAVLIRGAAILRRNYSHKSLLMAVPRSAEVSLRFIET